MSDFRAGDRVHVNTLATVTDPGPAGSIRVKYDDSPFSFRVPRGAMTLVSRAVKVGDIIDNRADLDALPDGTVIKGDCQAAAERVAEWNGSGWYWANGSGRLNPSSAVFLPAVVLYIGNEA